MDNFMNFGTDEHYWANCFGNPRTMPISRFRIFVAMIETWSAKAQCVQRWPDPERE
jgi:hypothetical protein